MSAPTIGEIIKDYLQQRGFDGLAGESCGCGVDELFLCEWASMECRPAFIAKCSECGEEECCQIREECGDDAVIYCSDPSYLRKVQP